MKFNYFITTVLVILSTLTFVGCQDFGQFPPPTLTPQPKTGQIISPTTVTSEDRAILAVYEHLLTLAQSSEAKVYLVEFYTISDNWSAEQELFKDGTSLWYVKVDMTGVKDWKGKPHWQEAGWFVYPDGKVIPANRLKANALMIEADLQRLSPPPKA